MARGDRLSLLAIATIFVVVIGAMHVAVEFSRGELFDREGATELEADLREAVWERIDAERVDRGMAPAQREPGVRSDARETARRLHEIGYFEADTAVGAPGGNRSLPNDMPLCYQVPAKYTVREPGWASGNVTEATLEEVADGTAGLFVRDGEALEVPNDHKHGIGVAIEGDVVYVVYRYCNLGY